MITAAKLRELKRLARAATQPGPWTVERQGDDEVVIDVHGMWLANVGPAPHDARFIAAMLPEVVLELIAELQKVRA